MTAERFGVDGTYRNMPLPVLARPVSVSFTLQRRAGGDVLQGKALVRPRIKLPGAILSAASAFARLL